MSAGLIRRLTEADIAAARTPRGGWTRDTLAAWGIPWPPPEGWRRKLVGHPIERPCPMCGAEAGHPCIGKRGQRKAIHRARGRRRKGPVAYAVPHLKTESPIEETLAGAILAWIDCHDAHVALETQVPIGPYRADILITEGKRKLVVECDGAAYHGSLEQVERDKRRDRYCAAHAMTVMRFSGAEINRDPRACAAEVGLWIRLR